MRFFISYTAADEAWAEWISWQLEAAGHEAIFQGWDFRPGENFVVRMRQALEDADRTLAVVSRTYLDKSVYGSDEWTAAFVHDQPATTGLLLVRVENVLLPRLLRPWIRIDLDGLDPESAARRLLEGVEPGRHKPDQAPVFPAMAEADGPKAGGPSFPGLGPAISNLAPRNPNFTGRAEKLEAVRQRLTEASAAAVVGVSTLYGLGGVGKTQLALEYAHRYAADYDLIWWVAAEEPLAIPGTLAALAPRLGIPPKESQQETTSAVLEELRQRDRWLLVYDNATDPAALAAYRPSGGGGHVLVTSRNPAWRAIGATVKVDVLPRHQAVELLIKRTGSANGAAAALADALGDLPLALEQAAAVVEETQMSLDEYLQIFGARRQEVLAKGTPFMYDGTVDASVQLAAEQVAHASQAGLELLHLCAFLAPDAIPLDLPAEAPEVLPEALAGAALDRLALEGAVAALLRYSLLDRELAGLRIHRLVQAVVEGSLAEERAVWIERVIDLLKAAWPEESYDQPNLWARCAQLLPHVVVAAGHAKQAQVALDRTAVLLTGAAAYARRRADFQAAQDLISQAVAIGEAAPPSEHASVGKTLASLGNVLRERGDFAGARAQLDRALQIHRAALGAGHSEVARDHTYLGSVLRELGELAAARAELECALKLHQQIYEQVGGTHAYVARDRLNLGLVLRDLGDLPRARAELEQALAIDVAVYGPKHPEVARDRTYLGLVLRDLGDLEGARKQCEQALAIDEATLGADHPHVARNRANLGLVLRDLGDLARARGELEQALAIDEAVLGSQHPAVGTFRWWLGEVLHDQGDVAGARAQLEGAHAILHAALGPEHPSTQAVAGRLADL